MNPLELHLSPPQDQGKLRKMAEESPAATPEVFGDYGL